MVRRDGLPRSEGRRSFIAIAACNFQGASILGPRPSREMLIERTRTYPTVRDEQDARDTLSGDCLFGTMVNTLGCSPY